MAKYVCTVCGYVHEGDEAPEFCPVCKAPASKFQKVEGEMGLSRSSFKTFSSLERLLQVFFKIML